MEPEGIASNWRWRCSVAMSQMVIQLLEALEITKKERSSHIFITYLCTSKKGTIVKYRYIPEELVAESFYVSNPRLEIFQILEELSGSDVEYFHHSITAAK